MMKKTEKLLAKLSPDTKEIDLENHRLTDLPIEVKQCKQLELLWLGINDIQKLPTWIGSFKQLRELSLFTAGLKRLPKAIGKLEKLECLVLTNNVFGPLPDLSGLTNLKTLCLSGCELTELPDWIEGLPALELLELSGNRLPELPTTIGALTKNGTEYKKRK